MGNACGSSYRISHHAIIDYLSSWPGMMLEWSNEDLLEFASCFKPRKIAAGKEVGFITSIN